MSEIMIRSFFSDKSAMFCSYLCKNKQRHKIINKLIINKFLITLKSRLRHNSTSSVRREEQ